METQKKLYPWIVETPFGKRRYWAEHIDDAVEKHIDRVAEDLHGSSIPPEESVRKVYMDVDALPDADDPVQITLRVADAEILRMLIDDVTLEDGGVIDGLDKRITEAHLDRIDAAVARVMIGLDDDDAADSDSVRPTL